MALWHKVFEGRMMTSNSVNALISQGDRQLSQGDFDAAEVTYRRALSLDRESVEGLYSMGCVYLARQEYEPAIQWVRKALAIDQRHAPSRTLLGNCLLGLE